MPFDLLLLNTTVLYLILVALGTSVTSTYYYRSSLYFNKLSLICCILRLYFAAFEGTIGGFFGNSTLDILPDLGFIADALFDIWLFCYFSFDCSFYFLFFSTLLLSLSIEKWLDTTSLSLSSLLFLLISVSRIN